MSAEKWMTPAKGYLGTTEVAGNKSNPLIVKFFAESGHSEITDDSVPWCSAFVGAVLYEAGFRGTGSLLARSWLDWKDGREVTNPVYGDVVVFSRGNSTWQGHVAFFVREDGDFIYALGGNQSDSVCYMKFNKSQVLGYRRPIEKNIPKPEVKPASISVVEGVVAATGLVAVSKPLFDGQWLISFVALGVFSAVGVYLFRSRRAKKPAKAKASARKTVKKPKST